jgi:putative oxidoreductase
VTRGPLLSWLTHPWLTIRLQIGLGVIFVAASLPKILDPPAFAHMVYNYRLVPSPLVNAMALAMPWFELLLGAALVLGLWRRTAAISLAGLLSIFIVAIGINLARAHPVNCGCFDVHAAGKSPAELLAEMRWVLLRDSGMLAAAALVVAGIGRERAASASEAEKRR